MRVFFYGELEAATEGFSSDRRIGGGGFGSVFKAVGDAHEAWLDQGGDHGQVALSLPHPLSLSLSLSHAHTGLPGVGECAVKRLDEGSMQGQLEFLQEVQVLLLLYYSRPRVE